MNQQYTSLDISRLIHSKVPEVETDFYWCNQTQTKNYGTIEVPWHIIYGHNGWISEVLVPAYRFDDCVRAIQVWGETNNKCRGCRLVDGFHEFDCPANDANSIGVLCERLLTAYLAADGFGERSEGVLRDIFE